MSKLQFKEFNTHQELTDFVNGEEIQAEDIVSINSFAIPPSKLPTMVLTYNPYRFHLFYWSYEDEIKANKEALIEHQKEVDGFFRGQEKEY